jgi:beta-xylosidase
MMKRTTGDYEAATFIVRLWRDSADPAEAASSWRGTAVHVQSGTERGIRELDGLVSFMQAWLQSQGDK